MKRIAVALLSCALLAVTNAPASAERLVTSLSTHQVLVSSNFTGTEVVLFGSIEHDGAPVRRRGGYSLVVTVVGPREDMVVRRKARVFGIWTNAQSQTFLKAPSYLAVLSNRPLDQIAPPETLRRLDVGMNIVPLPQLAAGIRSSDETFRDELIRLRKQKHLYVEDANGVTFLTPDLFRANIRLPAEAPVGSYEVEVRLFAENTSLARETSALEVVKVGVEQFLATAARDHGFLYGLATALLALLTGWLASIIFRRD